MFKELICKNIIIAHEAGEIICLVVSILHPYWRRVVDIGTWHAKYSKWSSETQVSYTLKRHHRMCISRSIQNGWVFKMVVVSTGCAIAVDHAFNRMKRSTVSARWHAHFPPLIWENTGMKRKKDVQCKNKSSVLCNKLIDMSMVPILLTSMRSQSLLVHQALCLQDQTQSLRSNRSLNTQTLWNHVLLHNWFFTAVHMVLSSWKHK